MAEAQDFEEDPTISEEKRILSLKYNVSASLPDDEFLVALQELADKQIAASIASPDVYVVPCSALEDIPLD